MQALDLSRFDDIIEQTRQSCKAALNWDVHMINKAKNTLSNSQGMGLYIHIPFCASKCAYCDFLSFEGMGEGTQRRYVDALLREMRDARDELGAIDTVYIGGGTPTALPSFLLCEVLEEVRQFNLSSDVEITLEMNPCTGPYSALAGYKNLGVNRLSVGLQAWQDHLLSGLRRGHTAGEFTQTMEAARAAGFKNINVDLMFALPGQTMEDWQESIRLVITHAPEHISTYSLTPAEGTPLWDTLESGKTQLPEDSVDRVMYHEAISLLGAAGYMHYELSNFALPGRESQHNIDCWRRKPYRGLGLGAHSFDGGMRWRNTLDMGGYLGCWGGGDKTLCCHQTQLAPTGAADTVCDVREDIEILSQRDAMAEMMILGLRMISGVRPKDFYDMFGIHLADCFGAELERLAAKGLIVSTPNRVALTALGLDLANQVFGAFL